MTAEGDLQRRAPGLGADGLGRVYSLFLSGVLLVTMGLLAPERIIKLGLLSAGGTLIFFGAIVAFRVRSSRQARTQSVRAVSAFIEKDSSPSFACTADGEILRANAAARKQFDIQPGSTLAGALRNTFANPGGILFRLKSMADAAEGAAREDLVTRRGQVRLAVHEIQKDQYLWRLESLADTNNARGMDGPALPMIMLGRTRAVLYMNDAARALIGRRVKTIDSLFQGAPMVSGTINTLMSETGAVDVLVSQVDAGAGRVALYLLPPPDALLSGHWQAFEKLPVPLVRFDAKGAVQSYNRMASKLIGANLVKGAHLSGLMEGLGRPLAGWLEETVSGRAVQQTEFLRLKNADNETFVQVALNCMKDGDDVSVLAVLSDATELKTLEAQFVQSQKMQAIGQLAGGVAHDFNNLLTAISGHCDLLLLRHDQGDADYGDLIQINQNANRAAALVGQLLAFSRKQTLRTEELDLRDTMADLTHLLNRLVGEKVTLTLTHDPVLKSIRADKRQLEQVLMNLVVNARDAMPGGGEVRIQTECLTLNEVLERDRVSVPAGQYVCVRVSDQGVGIPADKVQKVFEPFYTTKRTGEGTGLGLSTAYGIVKQTGGFIFVDSKVGIGTTFTIMFPVLDRSSSKPVKVASKKPAMNSQSGDGVILLVEDEAPVRAFASRALRLRGYTVLEADSAEAALKTLEDNELDVDLFVTDVVMPGKDGPSWVREALRERPGVRVVFVSGYAEDKLDDQKEHIPNSVFLPKPFSLNDLAETVHRQLH